MAADNSNWENLIDPWNRTTRTKSTIFTIESAQALWLVSLDVC